MCSDLLGVLYHVVSQPIPSDKQLPMTCRRAPDPIRSPVFAQTMVLVHLANQSVPQTVRSSRGSAGGARSTAPAEGSHGEWCRSVSSPRCIPVISGGEITPVVNGQDCKRGLNRSRGFVC